VKKENAATNKIDSTLPCGCKTARDVFQLQLGQFKFIVVTTEDLATDLLGGHGGQFLGRFPVMFAEELNIGRWVPAFQQGTMHLQASTGVASILSALVLGG
jgi:hypothetical protein